MMGQMNGLKYDETQTDDDGNLILPPSASELAAAKAAQSPTPTSAATPSATSHGAAGSTTPSATPTQKASPKNKNPLGKIPVLGPLLSGKAFG